MKIFRKSKYLRFSYSRFWFEGLKNQTNYWFSSIEFDRKLIKQVFITESSRKISVQNCPILDTPKNEHTNTIVDPWYTCSWLSPVWCGDTWRELVLCRNTMNLWREEPWEVSEQYRKKTERIQKVHSIALAYVHICLGSVSEN